MFAKTFCKPSSFVEVVPIGMLVKLEYNQHGVISRIFTYEFEDEKSDKEVEVTDKALFQAMSKLIPDRIPLSGGTTYVDGVFYMDEIPADSGITPYCMYDSYKNAILSNPQDIEFYAITADSLAASFSGAVPIRNWLSIAQFKTLPGSVVLTNFSDDTLRLLSQTGASTFKFPYLAGIYVFNGQDMDYIKFNLYQARINDLDIKLDQEGFVMAVLDTDAMRLTIPYSTAVKWNTQKGNILLWNSDAQTGVEIGACTDSNPNRPKLSNTITCPVCHKSYSVSTIGLTECDDPTCLSRTYPDTKKMLRTLNLPEISWERYKQAAKDNEILMFTDVLSLPEYSEMKKEASLPDAIRAITPVDVCADEGFFTKLATSCNDSVETLMYYAQNPIRLRTDLNIVGPQANRFVDWLAGASTHLIFNALFSQINIVKRTKKFDGAPIFRSNTIMITGKFVRGTQAEIISILESYSATVITNIDDKLPQVLITGGTNDSIDGHVIRACRANGIPIMTEDEFFTQYEIDKDLVENLL